MTPESIHIVAAGVNGLYLVSSVDQHKVEINENC